MANVKIKPIGDRVLVEHIEEKEQVRGGIIIPDSAKEKPQEAKVIALGTGKKGEDGLVMNEGESMEGFRDRLKKSAAPKKSSISADMLDTANTYDDKVALIRLLVAEDSGRVANVLKSMIRVN